MGTEPGAESVTVADVRAFVTDTHPLLLHAAGRRGLGSHARMFFQACESRQDEERPNLDPFDALICASARSLQLPLITRDTDIAESALVSVAW